jgi:hypothetical protein
MNKSDAEIKHFNVRIPKELWMFLKLESARSEIAMTDIICSCLEKFKKRIENKLTRDSADV